MGAPPTGEIPAFAGMTGWELLGLRVNGDEGA